LDISNGRYTTYNINTDVGPYGGGVTNPVTGRMTLYTTPETPLLETSFFHEVIHEVLLGRPGTRIGDLINKLHLRLYARSSLSKYTEEFLAEFNQQLMRQPVSLQGMLNAFSIARRAPFGGTVVDGFNVLTKLSPAVSPLALRREAQWFLARLGLTALYGAAGYATYKLSQ
jgi:hypothetical protein